MPTPPPPLFKQGTPARVKGILFSLIAVMLLVMDARFQMLQLVRQTLNTVLYPIQMAMLMPRDAVYRVDDYFARLSTLEKQNAQLKHEQLVQALEIQQGRQARYENAQLRQLLDARQQLALPTIMATILYDARDSFSRRIILDRGTHHDVALGQPVIDDKGVIGQVTRVFPLTSEVSLLTDKDQAIPVQVQRNGLRSVLSGKGQLGKLEMRVPSSADIQVGDILVTSGIDGVYPSGLAVARVTVVEHNATSMLERIVCAPIAGLDQHRDVLIVLTESEMAERPEEVNSKPPKVNRKITRGTTDAPARQNQNESENKQARPT